MIYLNIQTATLRAPEYVGCDPTQRATWLNLLAYCCEQENGGRIEGCAPWKDRQWQQTLGITLSEVQQQCDLWTWDGEAVEIAFYPLEREQAVRAKREAGKRGGKTRSEAKTQAARSNGAKHQPKQNPSTTEAEPKQEPNKRKEKKRKDITTLDSRENVAAVAATSDEDWLAELQRNPAYASLNVLVEANKMRAWCSANGKQPTRKRFINWLNRADRPIAAAIRPAEARKPLTAWEIRQAIEAAEKEISRLKGDPANSEPINAETPWERRMKPEVAARMKELKARAQELNGKLALLGREAA